MVNINAPRLVRKSEIDAAIALWNALSEEETGSKDPFNGYLGRSGASAYNFLMLATAYPIWMEEWLVEAITKMTNYHNPDKPLSKNKDHIKRLLADSANYGVPPVIRVNEKQFQVNPAVLSQITFAYVNAAIQQGWTPGMER